MSNHSVTVSVADQIIAFIPAYSERGESTTLWLQAGGSQVDPRSIRTCLREFWNHYSFDWPSYRREYAALLNRRNLLPWPADIWRTFAPAKLRSPQIGRDPAYGYFAVEQVEAVLPGGARARAASVLLLKDDRRLPVYLEAEELHRSLQAAAYAFQLYWGKRLELRPTMASR